MSPDREYLGARRAPLEFAVAAAHGWSTDTVRDDWTIDGRVVGRRELLGAQLARYATRADVVADMLSRHAPRIVSLGLDRPAV